MVSCITALVTHSETEGLSWLFSRAKTFGNVPSFAAAYGICAIMIVNASQLVIRAMITPRFMIQPPQRPTIPARIGAVEGLERFASSA